MQPHALHPSRRLFESIRTSSRLCHAAALCLTLSCSALACSGDDEDESTDDIKKDGGASDDSKATSKPSQDNDKASSGDSDAKALSSTLMTPSGPIAGEVTDYEGKQVLFFRGVPYAQPPTGDLRWKAPVAVEPWKETRDATQWGNRCPQGESTLSSPGPMNEDCLYLNVLTPATKPTERLPVMVFFHGGGLTVGTGNSPTYCFPALPAQGVVVVTVNSRLGAFGYFSHPGLAKESDHNASGNYGTLDLIESLRWVQKNITAFGGDPKNVTIFGESGGGSKVLSCMASPLAKGLFHRAIIESGSRSSTPMATTARADAEARGQMLATKLGVSDGDDAVKELRAKSWEDLLAASIDMNGMFQANLAVDGYVLPAPVNEIFEQGKQIDVPLIVGANEGEVGEFMSSIPNLAANMSTVTSKAYVYNFTHLPAGWRDAGCYAFHGLELAYVFGHMEGVNGPTMIYLGSRMGCMPMKDPMVSDEDRTVAKNMMTIWKQFATTGNPSVRGLVDWPAFTKDNDTYLSIGAKLEVRMGVSASGKMPGNPSSTSMPAP
jgi:para-nitrobenzyl esterase